MKICVIAPIVLSGPAPGTVNEYARAAPPGCQVETVFLDRGPASIESEYEEVLAAPDIVVKARKAEEQGADAIVVSCILDPGVAAARELVSIPVWGPGQVSMHVAAMSGPNFSIVTVLDHLIPALRRRVSLYGLSDRLASIRTIQVPVLALRHNSGRVVEILVSQSVQAIEEDRAYTIILGCTALSGMGRTVQDELYRRGYSVPVIDPTLTAIKVAAALADVGLFHSKLAYPIPSRKSVTGYPDL
ncbi:MAG: aspartate/glutamate racemase family protein [Anaerolineae bacterium]